MSELAASLPRLPADIALPLLHDHRWSPETAAACLMHVMDWLDETGQLDAAETLRAIEVIAPNSSVTLTLGALRDAEFRTSELDEMGEARRMDPFD